MFFQSPQIAPCVGCHSKAHLGNMGADTRNEHTAIDATRPNTPPREVRCRAVVPCMTFVWVQLLQRFPCGVLEGRVRGSARSRRPTDRRS